MSTPPDTILGTNSTEQRWIQEMRNTFFPENAIDTINRILHDSFVYRVPKHLSDPKPEAYTPQQLALGPFHHLRPHLYKTQKLKIKAIGKFLTPEQLKKFPLVIAQMMLMEPFLRSCYDEYLDLDIETLAWIFAIDGLYLMFLGAMRRSSDLAEANCWKDEFTKDVFMLENQVPIIVLREIAKTLELPPYVDDGSRPVFDDPREADMYGCLYLFRELHGFCERHSPMKLNEDFSPKIDAYHAHLLHRIYNLIVSNRGVEPVSMFKMHNKMHKEEFIVNIKGAVNAANDLGVPGSGTILNHLKFMESVPWDKILGLFKKGDPDEQNHLVEEIEIPSVSQLTEIAGITFQLTNGGISDVKFVEEEKKFYLPVIRLGPYSEVILRNLVAFEAAMSAKMQNFTPGLVQYVDLMCGIVDTPKDVEILRKSKIIEGDLPDEEIARVFNGIKKSTGSEMKSNIQEAIQSVNMQYDHTRWVKGMRLLKRHVYASWKCLTVFSTIILILLLTVQAFCSVYGCSKRWFGS